MKRKTSVRALSSKAQQVTTAAARRAGELIALIERRRKRIAEDFYEIGQALRDLKSRKLYVALGFASFAEMVEGRGLMSVRTAEKLIEVVEAVPRVRALELGAEKAYALARLAASTPEPDDVEQLLTKGVKVGRRKKDVTTLSTREIEEVARDLRPKARPTPTEREARALARALQAALRRAGAREATVGLDREAFVVRMPRRSAEAVTRALA